MFTSRLAALSSRLDDFAPRVQNLAPFLARLVFGQAFLLTGIGKLRNLDRTASFFAQLGIPYPEANAVFVGGVEAVGGTLIVLGLFTRPLTVLLSAVMVVAIATADRQAFFASLIPGGEPGLTSVAPAIFLLTLLSLFAGGPGAWSLDAWLARRAGRLPADALTGAVVSSRSWRL